ncbi:transcription elongation factor GreB [Pseudomonas sp. FME51]|uniref:transcription elongation factor GreB n=1 Tax=Pseudomonas sp. FME51 TaxID=2742609 RepID=UPI001866ACFC|nr:transcription elongation factor GreB [Pseudomonas sp. FME51]
MKRNLITPEGYDKLKDELDYLTRQERPAITKIVTWAASLGDRSENADYTYNKRKLREIDRRTRYLIKILESAERVYYHPQQEGKVFFGAWCTLENEGGAHIRFRIVGEEEVYGNKNYISLRSPMAKSCLGKSVDDEVCVHTPSGDAYWVIRSISYCN